MFGWKPFSKNKNVASARYRCYLPMHEIKRRGVPVEQYDLNNRDLYEAVIFSKSYSTGDQKQAKWLSERGCRTYLDLCDNHLYNPYALQKYDEIAHNLKSMAGIVDRVICSTPKLAEIMKSELKLAYEPLVVGDPIEPVYRSLRSKLGVTRIFNKIRSDGKKQVLWFGNHGSKNAPGGMLDILAQSEQLANVNKYIPIELVVISNNEEKYEKHIKPLPFSTRYVGWSKKTFGDFLFTSDVVIIPVTDNPFTICKTNNRIVTSLLYGVPVVADSIPSYRDLSSFCYLDNWEDGLLNILSRPDESLKMVRKGQDFIHNAFNIEKISNAWLEVLYHKPNTH